MSYTPRGLVGQDGFTWFKAMVPPLITQEALAARQRLRQNGTSQTKQCDRSRFHCPAFQKKCSEK